ncbi:MAG: heavy-metal-associated domain-containing protein [Syntrophomonadaceae bacterium]|nr:heavy-metal-associated domain-containing protein [Syntrophomonadaceae bacterium]
MFQKLIVEGMSCQHCKKNIESTLQELSGMNKVTAYHDQGFVEVDFDDAVLSIDKIIDEIEDLGFEVKSK